MGTYVDLGPVHTYFERHGTGDPLVLLHPGGADSRVFADNLRLLDDRFEIFAPDRRGHGRTPDVNGPISYQNMADDTIAFMETVIGKPVFLLGHSDGAPVALLVALARPDLVRRLVFASAVYHHTGWAPGAIDLDNESMAFFTEFHGLVSPDGPDRFPALAAKLRRMHLSEPTLTETDLARYPGPALVMVGDDDHEIGIDHTLSLRNNLAHGQLAIIPNCGHGLFGERPELCNAIVSAFLTDD
jgi:pimeloyl-ACP methyl ester carboxylesterase